MMFCFLHQQKVINRIVSHNFKSFLKLFSDEAFSLMKSAFCNLFLQFLKPQPSVFRSVNFYMLILVLIHQLILNHVWFTILKNTQFFIFASLLSINVYSSSDGCAGLEPHVHSAEVPFRNVVCFLLKTFFPVDLCVLVVIRVLCLIFQFVIYKNPTK